MNWTPGRIVGTVKPAGAAVDPISAGMVVPCPVPAPVVPAVVQTITVPKPVPAGTVAPAAAPMPNGSALLMGSVQSLAGGAGGDKIVGTVNIAGSSKPGLSSEELKQLES
uniref:(northern house mosquito) hypothetical protein n=1 Tax=Culex pipiens TaxID=7175 RepID=A0A8D8AS61_CULPI